MRAAASACLFVALGLAVSACGEGGPGSPANNAAITDIETLPPDESVATPTGELVNGAAEPTNRDSAQPQERSE